MQTKEYKNLATIQYDPQSNIVLITYKNRAVIELKEIKEIIETTLSLVDEKKRFFLITDIREITYMSQEARKYAAHKHSDRILGNAVIVKDIITQNLLNIFMKFARPPYPVKSFTNLEEAKKWAQKVLEKD